MIKKLTAEQEAQIPVYIKKWINQASVPMDEAKATTLVKKMYGRMEEREPIVIIGDSPLNTCLLASFCFSLLKKGKPGQLYSQLYSQLRSQLDSQLDSQLGSQLDSQLDSQLYSQIKRINSDLYLSIYWLIWCGWYEYGKMIGAKFDEDKYELFINFNSEINFIIPYNGICFISRKPTEIHWKGQVLHCESGGAVKYADGYSMFMLNGVRMEEKHVMTKAEEIDVAEVIKESNVDVRRELIRKIGIERFIVKAGAKVLDKRGDYELLSIKLSDEVPDARYLKMLNPSIGIWHVEGVEGDTVQEALNFRAGNIKEKWEPAVLT